ncbi:MAG: hypothetical protein ACP5QA_11170 [Phycisphaerae bacterium]
MMKWFIALTAVALFGLESTARLSASPLNPKEIPARAQFVVYANFDAMRIPPAWMRFCNTVERQPRIAAWIGVVRRTARGVLGIRSINKIHDMTIFGSYESRISVVALVHASFKPAALMVAGRLFPDYTEHHYGKYTILSWNKNPHRTIYLACYGRSLALIGSRLRSVENEIDTLDGKVPALTEHSKLLAGSTRDEMLYMAAAGINRQNIVKSAVFRQIDRCWMRASENKSSLVIRSQAMVVSSFAASQIGSVINGIKSQIELAGMNASQHAAMARAAAVSNIVLSVKGRVVHADWTIPNLLITRLLPALTVVSSPH